MIVKNLQDFEPARKINEKVVFETCFRNENMVKDVARFEVAELKRILRNASNVIIPEVEEMERYLVTLLKLRVNTANDIGPKEYSSIVKRVNIPARWYTILCNVGQAFDHTRNFKFMPKFDINNVVQMTAQEMTEMSELLDEYYADGYTTVAGVPNTVEGEIHFMAKTAIDDIVIGTDVTNPVYAFLSAVLQAEVISDTYEDLSLMFRVQYSDIDTYKTSFRDYFRQATECSVQKSTSHNNSHAIKPGKVEEISQIVNPPVSCEEVDC